MNNWRLISDCPYSKEMRSQAEQLVDQMVDKALDAEVDIDCDSIKSYIAANFRDWIIEFMRDDPEDTWAKIFVQSITADQVFELDQSKTPQPFDKVVDLALLNYFVTQLSDMDTRIKNVVDGILEYRSQSGFQNEREEHQHFDNKDR